MNEPNAGRRIVSREEYFLLQGKRVATGVGSLVAFLMALWTLYIAGCIVAQKVNGLYGISGMCVFFVVAICAYFLMLQSRTLIERAKEIDTGIPLTRANAADLPAPDSLVRASQEPVQAQEAVLLQAASGEAQAEDEAQLLRASVGGQE